MSRVRVAAAIVAALSAAGAVAASGLLAHGLLGGGGPAVAHSGGREADGPAAHRRIEINLTSQRLAAYEDDRLVHDFRISTGPATPAGTFRIWKKHRLKDMRVGLVVLGRFFVLEDVPFIMFYEGEDLPRERGFAIHGAYWHESFGRPVSHGCVNLRIEEAGKLFYWTGPDTGDADDVVASEANPGTEVTVVGSAG